MKKLFSLFISVAVLFTLSACKEEVKEHSATRIMMDTVITLNIFSANSDVLNGALELCEYYEQLFSRTVENSDISRINNSKGAAVTVNSETAKLIESALEIYKKSDGAFDFTVTPLVELWNVNEAVTPPPSYEISALLPSVNGINITLSENTVTALNNAKIDLGGIAKGYIADRLKEYFLEQGITRGTINLGGNVMLIGDNDGSGYNVGIQKPFAITGESALTIRLSDKTAVTSGIYERYFEHDGKIYHHIIDPKTGYPVDNDISSVTIIADSSLIADGLSTACLVLGFEQGTRLAQTYNAETVFILKDGTIKVSNGLEIDQTGDIPCVNYKFNS